MSQITTSIMNIGPAGPIVTLTGNSGGAVAPDGAGNIDVVGATNSFMTVTGTPGSNLLTISKLDESFTVVNTTDAVPYQVGSMDFPFTVARAVVLTYELVAVFSDTYSEMFAGIISDAFLYDGVNPIAPQIGGENTFTDGFAGTPSVYMQINGLTVELYVVGVAATNIRWKVVQHYQAI